MKTTERMHREPTWPLMGYAPGNYMRSCDICGYEMYEADKRAYHCLPCAIEEATKALKFNQEERRKLQLENSTLRAAILIVQPEP
jgi:hypothetical protein